MRKRKFFAILLAGALATGCLAGPAYALSPNTDVILETTPDISALDGQILTQQETGAQEQEDVTEETKVQETEEKEVTIDEDKVEAGAETFEQKLVYQTYHEDDDPADHLPQQVTVHGETYVLSNTGTKAVISREDVVPKTLSYDSEVFTGDGADHEPETSITGTDGTSYKLVTKELNEQTAQERTEYKETVVEYTAVEAGVQIPDQKESEFEDLDTKQNVTAVVDLKNQETIREYWVDDFSFKVTVTDYDADVFVLNGKEVPKDANLTDYAEDFLVYLKLDSDAYKIDNIAWSGDAYESNGTVVRNAVASGSKLVRDIKATYGGEVTLPAIVGKTWHCVYEEDIPEDETVIYTMSANAEYTKKDAVATVEKSLPQKIWDRVVGVITAAYEAVITAFTEHPVISSIPLVVLAAFLAIFIAKKRKNACVYDNSIRCPYKKRGKDTCKSCINYHKRQKI